MPRSGWKRWGPAWLDAAPVSVCTLGLGVLKLGEGLKAPAGTVSGCSRKKGADLGAGLNLKWMRPHFGHPRDPRSGIPPVCWEESCPPTPRREA